MNQISPLAYVHPEAKLGDNNIIGPFCYIDRDVEIGDNNVMQNSVTIHVGARIGSNNEFFPGASISTKPQDLKFRGEETTCVVGDNNSIRENVTISRGTASKGKTVVGSNNLLMENMHVGHDCVLGSGLIIGNSTKLAGEVVIDDNAILSGCVLVHQFCHIGGYVMVQGGSRSPMDIPPYIIAGRDPLKYCGLNIVGLRRRGFQQGADRPHPQHLPPALQHWHTEGRHRGGTQDIAYDKGSGIHPQLRRDFTARNHPIDIIKKTLLFSRNRDNRDNRDNAAFEILRCRYCLFFCFCILYGKNTDSNTRSDGRRQDRTVPASAPSTSTYRSSTPTPDRYSRRYP